MKFRLIRNIFARWKRAKNRPEIVPRKSIPRRTVLKAGMALGGMAFVSSLPGCRTAPLTVEQVKQLEKIRELRQEPPIITSLRAGRSVKQAFEETPFAHSMEKHFLKKKAGEIQDASIERSWSWGRMVPPDAETRSMIHSHTTWDARIPTEHRLNTIPSALDILQLLSKYHPGRKAPKLKFSHVAIISPTGKVMGYYSLMIGKKLDSLLRGNWFTRHSKNGRELEKCLDELVATNKLAWNKAPLAAYMHLEKVLPRLKKLGLNMRQTPMPGYEFKDGYFQEKKEK